MTWRSQWATVALIVVCYTGWLFILFNIETLGLFGFALLAILATFHSSLQHEAIHGHPTRLPWLNEVLVFLSLGLWFPYRRYAHLHLQHHTDERLTDPYDDPESWYYTRAHWCRLPHWYRQLLQLNQTLAGRVVIGPLISLAVFYPSEVNRLRDAQPGVRLAWLLHLVSVAVTFACVWLAGIHWLSYVLLVAYPSLALTLVRSFIEHRAAVSVAARTAVIEAGWVMSLLFLNNNLHAVHHRYPGLPWYRLPERWQQERVRLLCDNEGNHLPGGYGEVARRWLFRRREPVLHPYLPHDR